MSLGGRGLETKQRGNPATIRRELCVIGRVPFQNERTQNVGITTREPLHVGYADDKDGNAYQVRFEGRGTNLHAVWDSGLIRTWPGGTDALRAAVAAGAAKGADPSTPAQWAQESCRIVAAPGFYPVRHVLDDAYSERMDPVLLDRLGTSARRVAEVLNEVLLWQ